MTGRRRARWLLAALAGLLALGFASLGWWQVERRVWKLDLIARVESRIHAPARPLPPRAAWPGINERDHAYLRVRASGVLLHDREALVQALTERGPGFWVLTPLRTGEGVVLVNRGFVPPERRDPATRPAPRKPVTITGLLRITEPGGGVLRANDPGANRWYSRDTVAIARARGLGVVAPFFIDADATGGYPLGGMTVVRFRNTHLVYALTWFALAGLGLFAGYMLLRRDDAG